MRYLEKGSVQGLASGGRRLPGVIALCCLLATLFPPAMPALGTTKYGTAQQSADPSLLLPLIKQFAFPLPAAAHTIYHG